MILGFVVHLPGQSIEIFCSIGICAFDFWVRSMCCVVLCFVFSMAAYHAHSPLTQKCCFVQHKMMWFFNSAAAAIITATSQHFRSCPASFFLIGDHAVEHMHTHKSHNSCQFTSLMIIAFRLLHYNNDLFTPYADTPYIPIHLCLSAVCGNIFISLVLLLLAFIHSSHRLSVWLNWQFNQT